MRLSHLFTKTRKDAPADEVAKNAQLLIKAGFVHKEMAGVYDFLPLGMKVVENIKQIIREEMDAVGGNELIMSTLQRKELWEKTDRWDDEKVDVWFKTKLKNDNELGMGWSHEEPICDMMRSHISSYKDLPAYVYQFQNKLRNEIRAKSGVMRGREFVMKDMYSFSSSDQMHDDFYKKTIEAYHRVFKRLGIGDITYLTTADGGAFTQFSHEFQTICEAGEDVVYLDKKQKVAVNEEVMSDEVLEKLSLNRGDLEKTKTAEVGNIFSFGGDKSQQLGLHFTDEGGKQNPVILGSYGIGITRLVGVITEIMADDKGLVWPEAIAPAQVHIVAIGDDKDVVSQADMIHDLLAARGIDVLYDDRNERVGQMLADADLIGCPKRVVVSKKSLEAGGVEVKQRTEEASEVIAATKLIESLQQ